MNFDQIIQNKPEESFPDYAKNVIRLLSIDKNKSSLVGSYSFSYPLYPSDIDIREVVDGESYDKVVEYFISGITKKVSEISMTPGFWVLEVKAGMVDNNTPIRWNVKEILDGAKYSNGGKIVSLREAVMQKSVINMEVVGLVNGKYTDMSSFYALVYRDKSGMLKSVNLPDDSVSNFDEFYVKELLQNIDKLLREGEYAKVIKRYFSLGKFIGDSELIEKSYPFINSIYGMISQKKSEIAILSRLISHTLMVGVDREKLRNQLQNIKFSLANAVVIPREELRKMYNVIDSCTTNFDNVNYCSELLTSIKKKLSDIANKAAYNFLESNAKTL